VTLVDGRYQDVVRCVRSRDERPEGALDSDLYDLLVAGKTLNHAVRDAYDLYKVPEHRAAMDAFTLADATPELVRLALHIPESVTKTYRYLFMDVQAFRNKLERITYAQQYPGDAYTKEMMRSAITAGLDHLLWAFGASQIDVDSRTVIRQTMAEAYYRGMAHRGQSISSAQAKEAHRWWGTAVKNAELLERVDPRAEKQALEEIRIALEKHDDTFTASSSPVPPGEILH
jgi:hypothetical protein